MDHTLIPKYCRSCLPSEHLEEIEVEVSIETEASPWSGPNDAPYLQSYGILKTSLGIKKGESEQGKGSDSLIKPTLCLNPQGKIPLVT